MFGLSSIKVGGFALAAVAITTIIFIGYRHFTNLQSQVGELELQNQILVGAVEQQTSATRAAVQRVKEFADAEIELREKIKRLEVADASSRQSVDALRKKLSSHDLPVLAASKPILLGRTLTRASNRALLMLGCASGAQSSECAPAGAPTPRPEATPAGPGADNGGIGGMEGVDP